MARKTCKDDRKVLQEAHIAGGLGPEKQIVHIPIYIYIYIYACKYIYIYIYICICMYACLHIDIYMKYWPVWRIVSMRKVKINIVSLRRTATGLFVYQPPYQIMRSRLCPGSTVA